MERGWWTLSIEMFGSDEPDETTLEHIAELIKDGYTSGEVVQESDNEDEA